LGLWAERWARAGANYRYFVVGDGKNLMVSGIDAAGVFAAKEHAHVVKNGDTENSALVRVDATNGDVYE
jgi:hypothetical protein